MTMILPGHTLRALEESGLYRSLREARVCGKKIFADGKSYLNFASNDYLGISADSALQKEFFEKTAKTETENFVMGGTSSRLLGGNNSAFARLEEFFARAYSAAAGSEKKCLLFNSGYHANTGAIPAIADIGKTLILCDRLAHASVIDGLRLSESKWIRFRHNDMPHLRGLLEKHRADFDNVLIVTESVFSMDGDCADLRALVALKKEFSAMLYLDEAHAVGVFGSGGLGMCEECGVINDVDFIICTLGKAVASEGAFVVCDSLWRELLINRCRSFIFTTAIAPVNALWTKFIFEKICKMNSRREHLKKLSALLRASVDGAMGETQIVPIILGENEKALKLSQKLWKCGIWAPPVRHPSVPKGTARLRLSLTADMDEADIEFCASQINGGLQ